MQNQKVDDSISLSLSKNAPKAEKKCAASNGLEIK